MPHNMVYNNLDNGRVTPDFSAKVINPNEPDLSY